MAQDAAVPPILLTRDDAAAALGVSLNTVKRLVRSGEIPVRHVGHLVRIRYEDLRAYVDGLPPS